MSTADRAAREPRPTRDAEFVRCEYCGYHYHHRDIAGHRIADHNEPAASPVRVSEPNFSADEKPLCVRCGQPWHFHDGPKDMCRIVECTYLPSASPPSSAPRGRAPEPVSPVAPLSEPRPGPGVAEVVDFYQRTAAYSFHAMEDALPDNTLPPAPSAAPLSEREGREPRDKGHVDYLLEIVRSYADTALRDPSPDSDGLYPAILKAMEGTRLYIAALRASLATARAPVACGVCLGQPLKSGKPCICGGVGTEQAEMHGLRAALFDAEAELASARSELDEARRDTERLDELQRWTEGDQIICPPGEHGGGATNWLLSREDPTKGDRYGNWTVEHEAPTLREAIDAARAARSSQPGDGT